MSNIVIESVIGPDGTLHLDVPIGIESANQPVRVVIEAARKPMTRAEWGAFVRSMAGSINRSDVRAASAIAPRSAGVAVVTYLLDTNTCKLVLFALLLVLLGCAKSREDAADSKSGKKEDAVAQKMDPAKVPDPLKPFVPLFEKWGDARSDFTRYALADRAKANPAEMAELRDFHTRLSRVDLSSCQKWLDGPLTESYERAKIYFTYLLFDELEIK